MTRISVTPQHDLPDWIQRARQGIDWGALFVLLLSLLAASRFMMQPNLPLTVEGESILFRTADMVAGFREGRLYPRWSPHVLHGYGAPILHYTPPGVPWTAAAIAFVTDTDPVNTMRALWVIGFVMAGMALYALVMRRVHAVAGFVAAALYLYSPYIGLTLPHITGSLTEMMGLSLSIMHLWAANRLWERNSPWDAAGVALTGAALILTSPLHAAIALLISLPLLTLVPSPRAAFRRLYRGWGVSLLMSAFYWLPALLEQGLVRWLASPITTRHTPLTFTQLLRPAVLFDPAEMLPLPQLGLGGAILITASLSLMMLWWRQRRMFRQQMTHTQRWWVTHHKMTFQLLYLSLGIAGVLGLISQSETPTWFLGVLTLCFAIGSTLFLDLRTSLEPQGQRVFLAVTTFLLILAAIPILFPSRPFLITNTSSADAILFEQRPFLSVNISPAGQIQYEQQGLGIAGVTPGVPVPTTLTASFLQSASFVTGYETDTINRFSIDARDQNRASVVQEAPEMHIFQVWHPSGGLITMQIASFEGWSASLDGVPVPTSTDAETGLLQIMLPPSSGQTLVVTLETTLPRLLGWLMSGIGLLSLALWIGWRFRHDKPTRYQVLAYFSPAETRLLAFVLALTIGVAFVGYQGLGDFSLRPQGWYAIRDSVFLRSRSNGGLELLAYRLDQSTVHGGDTIPITLYWQTTQTLNTAYIVELSLRNVSSGATLSTASSHPPAFYSTRRWIRSLYMRDDTILSVPHEIPTGRYVIAVKVYPCEQECRPNTALNFFDASGQLAGTLLTLPQVLDIAP